MSRAQKPTAAEERWATEWHPNQMLTAATTAWGGIDGKHHRRKLNLFAVACCRRAWALLAADIRAVVEAVERYADGAAAPADVDRAWRAAMPLHWPPTSFPIDERLTDDRRRRMAAEAIGELGRKLGGHWAVQWGNLEKLSHAVGSGVGAAADVELAAQAEILRDVLGNPFRPAAFAPDWRTDTVLSLARQMYESREFSAIPILADALQDAGCDDEAVLAHCRHTTHPHVRGCWVIDLVLGKQ